MFNLQGKTALVTGASGGIGKAIASKLHQQGAFVLISGTRREKLEELATELKERVEIIQCDLTNEEQLQSFIDNCYNINNRLDIVVCNAGVNRDNLALRMSNEDFDHVISVNLCSTFIINKAAIKKMVKQRYGRIINISSIVGFTGNLGQANYTAAKAGLVGMSKSLALEVATRNITINCIAPGFIATAMTDAIKEEMKQEMLKKIPQAKFGTPDDIASATVYLASDEANYVTGQTLHVNGGMAMY